MITNMQKDLKNGLSIEDVCKKYNVSFKELVKLLGLEYVPRKIKKEVDYTYIIPTKSGKWRISHPNNGKTIHYGTYDSLEMAIEIRDLLIKFKWDKDYLPLILRGYKKKGDAVEY